MKKGFGRELGQFVIFVGIILAVLAILWIATKLGFSDPTYFFPFFKLHTGISPHKYKQNEKNGEREDP